MALLGVRYLGIDVTSTSTTALAVNVDVNIGTAVVGVSVETDVHALCCAARTVPYVNCGDDGRLT